MVIAKPRTGRTHQIRIHLRYLGYPIANDPCYGGKVYNGLKDLDNPDFLKFHQIVPHLKSEKDKETSINHNLLLSSEKILLNLNIYLFLIKIYVFYRRQSRSQ